MIKTLEDGVEMGETLLGGEALLDLDALPDCLRGTGTLFE